MKLIPNFAIGITLCCALTASNIVFAADTVPLKSAANDQNRVQPLRAEQEKLIKIMQKAMFSEEDKAFLSQNQSLFEQYLLQTLVMGNTSHLQPLLDVYKTQKNYDASLIIWGEALIAFRDGEFHKAINYYRSLISDFPKLSPARLQLAMALFYDRQYVASRTEFQKLSSLDDEMMSGIIRSYVDAIDSIDKTNYNLSFNFLNDNNINRVVKKGTRVTLPNGGTLTSSSEQQSAHGISLGASIGRQKILPHHFYLGDTLSLYGNFYLDNADYNMISINNDLSLGYRNAYTNVQLTASLYNQWKSLGEKNDKSLAQYLINPGISLSLDQQLSQRLSYSGSVGLSYYKYYFDDVGSSGPMISADSSLRFTRNPQQVFYIGGSLSKNFVKDKAKNTQQSSVYAGWGQEWPKGFSSNLKLTYAHKSTDGKYLGIFDQINDKFSAEATLWHRNIHFWGITPKLVLSTSKTYSTNPFNRFSNNNLYLKFSKSF